MNDTLPGIKITLQSAADDCAKVDELNNLANEFLYADAKLAYHYAMQAGELAERCGDLARRAQALHNHGLGCHLLARYGEALNRFRLASICTRSWATRQASPIRCVLPVSCMTIWATTPKHSI